MEAKDIKLKRTTFTVLNYVVIIEEMQICAKEKRSFIHTRKHKPQCTNTYTPEEYEKWHIISNKNRRKQKTIPEC